MRALMAIPRVKSEGNHTLKRSAPIRHRTKTAANRVSLHDRGTFIDPPRRWKLQPYPVCIIQRVAGSRPAAVVTETASRSSDSIVVPA